MKELLLAVLLACCQVVSAQIKIELPETVADKSYVTGQIRAAKSELKAYADSLFKAKGDGGGTQNPPNNLPKCDRGPEPRELYNVTTTGATVLWDGENVFGWDYSIYKGTTRVAFGSVKPTSNREPITYAGLEPGEYTISMQGNTCKSDVYSKTFVVPKPTGDNGNGGDGGNNGPPPVFKSRQFEYFIGTTGGGFDPNAKYGIKDRVGDDEGWVERIEAYKYSWGYGITGISLWIYWDGYEPVKGKYETEALKRVISFCRERDLKLSVVFLARRKRNDGFIREDEMVTFSNGSLYMEGPHDQPNVGVWAGYGCDRVNQLMAGAIKDIAATLKTYDKAYYMALAGGHTGELVNHVTNQDGRWYSSDFSADNLSRFNTWVSKRGLAQPGRPPMIEGPGIDWPYPDFNHTLGLEFGRFQSYNLYKQYKAFCDAVKSVYNFPCIYFYAAASNRQLRSTANANMNFIASPGDGMYGSDGDGLYDNIAKIRVNSVNLGTFPNGISCAEYDPTDASTYIHDTGRVPEYCKANPDYGIWVNSAKALYSKGAEVIHDAMAFCVDEIRRKEPAMKELRKEYIGKAYHKPDFPTVTINVTEKYRRGEDLLDGVDVNTTFAKYTDEGFWGGVSPEVGDGGGNPGPQPSKDYSPVKSYVEANLADAYNWNAVFSLRSPSKELFSFEKGGKTKDTRFKVMSHSKFVTGVIISYLIEQGKLSLDTKVGDIIRSWDRPGRAEITLGQIMGHLSGIPDNTDNEGAETLEYYVNELVNKPGFTTPGTQFIYSTSSYQVAARMAELVTGKAWKDLFREILADPCEMGDAEFHPAEGPIPGKPLNPLAGYGLQCSVNQWMNFIGMVRDKGIYKGRRVLSERVFDILKTPTSPGWSDWCVGVMVKEGKYVSEAASGPGTTILEGYYAWTIFTDSSYEKTYWQNIEVRKLVDQIFRGL